VLRPISTQENFPAQKLIENIIVKNRKFSNSEFFSEGNFVLANHILQNFLSAENFPEWKWALNRRAWG
jgi:hypothetical protein